MTALVSFNHDWTLNLEHRGLWEGLDGGRFDVALVRAWVGVTGEDLRGLGVDVAARHGRGVSASAGVKVERQSRICFDEQLTLSRRVERGILLNEDSSGVPPNPEGDFHVLPERWRPASICLFPLAGPLTDTDSKHGASGRRPASLMPSN